MAAVAVMVLGVLGTLIPALPGLPVIFLAMLGYGAVEGFREMTPGFLIAALLVVAATQVAEHYARAWGARRFGAGRAGAWGAVIGSIAGLFFMPLGLVLGPFLGAALFELFTGRPGGEALRAGVGGLVGVLGSVAVNLVVALGLTVAFIVKVLI
ncbi:uncharacterized protein YqgC (DUF456 family) [Symbiobacterium terraclitae]|uniref:Uncharacterized protein YqgC (DUF456 family) n=2 Tax=Symbiobacterium terraclitae TaxID=557451 RepID=A0ABS4JMQ0_9FIRM|nr:DUF456 domain-containing protein [Symbiobacterium terraclitae]MBP2016809.1 uncharacterized protein YqgC (DUF456 family) [Symbiobacterium terraclitae]